MTTRTVAAGLVVCFLAASAGLADPPALDSDEEKTLYSLGLVLSRRLVPFQITEEELEAVHAGLADGVLGREPRVALEEYGPRIDGMLKARLAAVVEGEKELGATFRAEAAKEPGAETTESGLVYRGLVTGEGPAPGASDTVKLHYRGTLRDGSVFDSSLEGDDPQPATFRLDGVVPCFSEGVQKMKVGGKGKLTCPPELAYGDRGSPPRIPPGATLQFEVQLLEIVTPEPGPEETEEGAGKEGDQ